jgi:hemolysin activation/secretion protein
MVKVRVSLLVFYVGLSVSVFSQDFDRIAPKTLPPNEGVIATPKPKVIPNSSSKVLVQELKGMVFVSNAALIQKTGIAGVTGISAGSVPLLRDEKFVSMANDYIGKPLTLGQLRSITQKVILYFREHDHPVVDVSVPEQDVTSGVIQFVVLEGKIAKIREVGTKYFDSAFIVQQTRFHSGDVVENSKLRDDLNWLNNNPFRQIDAFFTPGTKRGETDLELKTTERFPLRFFGGYEDSGNDLTADERFLMGFNWGNAWGHDHQLNYQFTASPDFEKLTAHSGSYLAPLAWHHKLLLFGSYAETHADIANPLFDLKGVSWQTSLRYIVPLPSFDKYTHETSAGFDFKQSDNNLDFGGTQVFAQTTDIDQLYFDYSSSLADSMGRTSFQGFLVYSPGYLTENNTDFAFNAARASATSEYHYERLEINRLTRLPYDFTWSARGLCQFANGNLLGSEQLGLGGYSTVRGYDEREANGDEGYLFSTEIRTPPVSLLELFSIQKIKDQLQFLGFFDYGQTKNRILLNGEDPHLLLASVGPGLRYLINPYLTIRFDYGWQLYDTGLNQRENSRGHLGILVSY